MVKAFVLFISFLSLQAMAEQTWKCQATASTDQRTEDVKLTIKVKNGQAFGQIEASNLTQSESVVLTSNDQASDESSWNFENSGLIYSMEGHDTTRSHVWDFSVKLMTEDRRESKTAKASLEYSMWEDCLATLTGAYIFNCELQ